MTMGAGTHETDYATRMPFLPLRDLVIFPHMVVPLFVGRDLSIRAIEHALERDRRLLLVAQRHAHKESPSPGDLYHVGTVATIGPLTRLPDGSVKVIMEGAYRARLAEVRVDPSYQAVITTVDEVDPTTYDPIEVTDARRALLEAVEAYAVFDKRLTADKIDALGELIEPGDLADTIAATIPLQVTEKQLLLEMEDPMERVRHLTTLVQAETRTKDFQHKARTNAQNEEAAEREGAKPSITPVRHRPSRRDEHAAELDELEDQIEAKALPDEARERALKEVSKLRMMAPMAAEATVVRSYIEWILALPWGVTTQDELDITEAERILDEDHYGLIKVKERIVEHLAVQKLVGALRGPILCFAGPPGVGKTSLARSIARATGRHYGRLAMGGVKDEAEIRGHRRTYIGALPGKIIQTLRKVGSTNPVFCLDEVDKMSVDFRGDPSAALLEVLDPEQNHTFLDHYLDLDFDLSQVMFICTANNIHTIPGPLLDRMELIQLTGYTEDEKLHIAEQHLVPKQMEAHGLVDKRVTYTTEGLERIVSGYTREAGVRSLERLIASTLRKVATEVAREGSDKDRAVTAELVERYLGHEPFRRGMAEERAEVGIASGLAVTSAGGDLMSIEVAVLPGRGTLTITGKLGEVMQESAQAALSYIRRRADALGLPPSFHEERDIHIHVPEGAIPKDGPSAGITMATAVASALMDVPVRHTVAMTGEITLRGKVLPVGGVKEKLLAAHRAGIATVLIPSDNLRDIDDLPEPVKERLEVIPVATMDDVLRRALAVGDPSFLDT